MKLRCRTWKLSSTKKSGKIHFITRSTDGGAPLWRTTAKGTQSSTFHLLLKTQVAFYLSAIVVTLFVTVYTKFHPTDKIAFYNCGDCVWSKGRSGTFCFGRLFDIFLCYFGYFGKKREAIFCTKNG